LLSFEFFTLFIIDSFVYYLRIFLSIDCRFVCYFSVCFRRLLIWYLSVCLITMRMRLSTY